MIRYEWKGRRYDVADGTYDNYVVLRPIYGDKVTVKHSMPDNERYYTESFNGTLKFVRDDYEWVMQQAQPAARFGTIYEVELHAVDTTDQIVTTLKFVITDCEIDEDNGIISVKPTTKTRYDAILDGMDREFNLIDLNTVIDNLVWQRRAVLQFTTEESSVVTNCLGFESWEQDKANTSGSLTTTYKFGLCDQFLIAQVSLNGEGIYYGNSEPQGENMRDFDILRGVKNPTSVYGYKLRFFEGESSGSYYYGVQLYRSSSPFSTDYTLFATGLGSGRLPDTVTDLYLYNSNSQHVSTVSWRTSKLYARVLFDTYVSGAETRPTADIVPYDNRYRYVKPYTDSIATITNNGTESPTPYGQYTSYWFSGYYAPPAAVGYLPVMQSFWAGGISTWVDLSLIPDLDAYSRALILRHAYPLWSAIQVLLAQIAIGVSFGDTTDYSEFLFADTNPLTSDPKVNLFLTPKSNILNGDYKTPAYNAPIKLKDILEMLKNVYKCYWFIDDTNRLRIEHISWFMNGGAYGTVAQTVSYDLTQLINMRNGKAWAYDKNHYTFDKPNMPATYTFAWMDDVTQEFKGYQMEMLSMLVEKDKNEEITVGRFTTDIDFVTITPDDISKEGFMLLGAHQDIKTGDYYLPFYRYHVTGTNAVVDLQNGYLAYVYLQKNEIWLSNLPASDVRYADGSTAQVYIQSRMKHQDVVVPMTSPIFDPVTLIKTDLGKGEIQDIEINISSLTAKAKLRYDTQ